MYSLFFCPKQETLGAALVVKLDLNEDQDEEEGAGQFKLVQEQEKPHDDEEEEDPSDEDDVYADALIAKLQTSGMPIKK